MPPPIITEADYQANVANIRTMLTERHAAALEERDAKHAAKLAGELAGKEEAMKLLREDVKELQRAVDTLSKELATARAERDLAVSRCAVMEAELRETLDTAGGVEAVARLKKDKRRKELDAAIKAAQAERDKL